MLLTLALALAQPIDAMAIELSAALGGSWTVVPMASRTIDPGRTVAPVGEVRVRILATERSRSWSLTREVFATEAQAEEHVQAWARAGFPHYADEDSVLLWAHGHTKSWQRKLRHGPIVWELFAPCALPEAQVLALEARLEAAIDAEGSYGRCACGGPCALGDDRDRSNPPDPPWPERRGEPVDPWSEDPAEAANP